MGSAATEEGDMTFAAEDPRRAEVQDDNEFLMATFHAIIEAKQ